MQSKCFLVFLVVAEILAAEVLRDENYTPIVMWHGMGEELNCHRNKFEIIKIFR